MNHYVPILFIAISFVVLALGFQVWRLTNSRAILLNGLFASMSLLFAAFEATARNRPEWGVLLPFFATMLFGGRAAGYWWRSRKESELRLPAQYLGAAMGLSLVATVTGYLAL